jgi:hypothetical protein
MALTFPVISHGEVTGPVTDVFHLKTPWFVVQLWFEDELILLNEVKVSVVRRSNWCLSCALAWL